jgi:hypothetical protein
MVVREKGNDIRKKKIKSKKDRKRRGGERVKERVREKQEEIVIRRRGEIESMKETEKEE